MKSYKTIRLVKDKKKSTKRVVLKFWLPRGLTPKEPIWVTYLRAVIIILCKIVISKSVTLCRLKSWWLIYCLRTFALSPCLVVVSTTQPPSHRSIHDNNPAAPSAHKRLFLLHLLAIWWISYRCQHLLDKFRNGSSPSSRQINKNNKLFFHHNIIEIFSFIVYKL